MKTRKKHKPKKYKDKDTPQNYFVTEGKGGAKRKRSNLRKHLLVSIKTFN